MNRLRSRIGISLAALGLVLAVAVTASATVVLQLAIEDMIPMADVVVVGEVNKVEASFNAEKTRIHTRVWIPPPEVLQGPEGLGTVMIKTIGGQVGDTVAHLPGAPKFELGERVLVFCEPRSDGDGYLTVGFYQGKFKVFRDPESGRDLLLRDAPGKGVAVIDRAGVRPSGELRSLDEVRALFAGGAR